MPYELSFTKRVPIVDREQYINDCCIGGDIVAGQLLPAVRARYGRDIEANQEDWGWYIWFRTGDLHLAIDIFTDDPEAGEFRVHLTSSVKRMLFRHRTVDTVELKELHGLVVAELAAWVGSPIQSEVIER